jgi:hypothetical protein
MRTRIPLRTGPAPVHTKKHDDGAGPELFLCTYGQPNLAFSNRVCVFEVALSIDTVYLKYDPLRNIEMDFVVEPGAKSLEHARQDTGTQRSRSGPAHRYIPRNMTTGRAQNCFYVHMARFQH